MDSDQVERDSHAASFSGVVSGRSRRAPDILKAITRHSSAHMLMKVHPRELEGGESSDRPAGKLGAKGVARIDPNLRESPIFPCKC